VDDVRRVREKISAIYGGDISRHVEETNRIVGPLIEQLGLRRVEPEKTASRKTGATG
jgi:hypothetical protein